MKNASLNEILYTKMKTMCLDSQLALDDENCLMKTWYR